MLMQRKRINLAGNNALSKNR